MAIRQFYALEKKLTWRQFSLKMKIQRLELHVVCGEIFFENNQRAKSVSWLSADLSNERHAALIE